MEECETNSQQLSSLCDVLLEGFHVAAQPLTMLQAALSADCAALMPEAELRELTLTCSREADRLTRTFRGLKRLVQSYRYPAVPGNVELAEMLKSRIAGTALDGDGKPIPVLIQVSSELPAVIAARDATVEMLQTLIEVMAAYCDGDDTIVIRGEEANAGVQLTIVSEGCFLNRLPGEFKVALPLASTRMGLQQGTASWRTSPVAVELNFTIAMSAE
jgi:hypothetical protein